MPEPCGSQRELGRLHIKTGANRARRALAPPIPRLRAATPPALVKWCPATMHSRRAGRGLQREEPMTQMSAFEVLGPIMIGPSSSHTAGALRCAQTALALCASEPASVTFTLWNSFAHTYRGHGTDRALLGGILGFDTDDERIRDSFQIADERGLAYRFAIGGDDPGLHPNTVDIAITESGGGTLEVRGESLGGGRVRLCRINGVSVDILGEYETVFVSHRDVPGALASIIACVADDGVNIAFMKTYRSERGGMAYTVLEMDDAPADAVLQRLSQLAPVTSARRIHIPGATRPGGEGSSPYLFANGRELLDLCKRHDAGIGTVMRLREESLFSPGFDERMAHVLQVMRESSTRAIENPRPSLGGFIGGEARLLSQASDTAAASLVGAPLTQAVTRAMAVLEQNATMGVIVAAPTAGSSGVVPGCVISAGEALGAGEKDVQQALWCAAAVGMLLSRNASVAGAEGGCQAEVGSAAAMAAAALAQMLGGTPEQALNASSIALGNLLGLACDPIGGLVEAPCQNRNAIGVACAFTATQLSLAGIKAPVSFDEAADAMLRVGRMLPLELRETALGGLATCPSVCSGCGGRA